MAEFKIKRLVSGGMITNYFCTSRCRHCLYNCSPHWDKEFIQPQTAEENLRTIRERGCSSVHIGGGEPLLRPDALGEVLEIASQVGVEIEYVETNSAWFKDPDSAIAILSKLRQQGLQTLLVSISPFHNEYTPFSRVKGVIAAARQAAIGIFPWISDFIADLSRLDGASTHSLKEFEDIFGQDYSVRLLQRYWIHMGGRALETFRPYLAKKPATEICDENTGGCAAELLNTQHFHLDLFGNYIPGLCSGLSIKKEDLGKPLSENKYPVLTTLFDHGIRGIFKMAQDMFDYAPAKDSYINKCDLCTEIRTLFVQNDFESPAELKPRQFYIKK
ncbi:MAG: radical SAM protein [Desulfobacterales bacterium]